jgi:hypothetical protein
MKNLKYESKKEITLFIKNLKKKAKGHVLDIVAVPNGLLLYYREYGDFAYNSKTKLFSRM